MRGVPGSLVAALLLSILPAFARANCGAEGCPLVRDGFAAMPNRFAFDLRWQDVTQDTPWDGSAKADLSQLVLSGFRSGHGEVELYTRTRSWVGEARVRVTPWLGVTATLPYVQREHRHLLAHTPAYDARFVDTWKFEGLADATLLAHARAPRWGRGPALTFSGGVKLPTGRAHVPDESRENFGFDSTLEPSARPGTGSTDWLAGVLAAQPLPWTRALPLSASVLARWNQRGTDGFKVGNEVQAGLSGGYAALPWLTLLGQVNFSAHGSDVSAEPGEAAHSGMRSLYLTPGVSLRVAPAVSVYGLYQARAWGRSDEATVVATDHFLFGTTYSIGR